MKILISGATGMIGSALAGHLKKAGHHVFRLVRRKMDMGIDGVYWLPEEGEIDANSLNGFDVVINLAGENIASGRWTQKKKRKIRDSRVIGTRLLVDTLLKQSKKPKLLINASAVGYYGDRGDEVVTEESKPGDGFLSRVCQEWEHAASAAQEGGIRTIYLRIGVVLSSKGGALAKMLPPFRMGLGGKLGTGKQWMSWITLEDIIGIVNFLIDQEDISGPVNAVAPNPVTNATFTKTLANTLGKPAFFPMPSFVVRLLFGSELADAILLGGEKVACKRLEDAGYDFTFPTLKEALVEIL